MVELSENLDRDRVLEALDETPQTSQRLARKLDLDPEEVESVLEQAEADKLAVDWGDVWATTWRAKLKLEPTFFERWVPGSLALGAALTATAVVLNAPDELRIPLGGSLAAVALAAGTLALFPGWWGSG